MSKLLAGKKALITGASRGIGKEIALLFAQHGADVSFSYLNSQEKAKSFADELGKLGEVSVHFFKSDASDPKDAQHLVDQTLDAFGQIDILVNNAGITRDNLLMRMTRDDWDQVLRSNLDSVFNMTQPVVKYMMKRRSGSIINIGSVVGLKGNAGQTNYSASKSGIVGFSKSLALELGSRNIRCNVIAPGFIETEMTEKLDKKVLENWVQGIPLKRAGLAKEVANTAVFLGSDMSSYISGQVINVCGGMVT